MTAPLGVVRVAGQPPAARARPLAEEPLALAEGHREEDHPQLVDQVLGQQRLDQARRPVHLQLAAVLGLELPDGVPDVALQQLRGLPLHRVAASGRRRASS